MVTRSKGMPLFNSSTTLETNAAAHEHADSAQALRHVQDANDKRAQRNRQSEERVVMHQWVSLFSVEYARNVALFTSAVRHRARLGESDLSTDTMTHGLGLWQVDFPHHSDSDSDYEFFEDKETNVYFGVKRIYMFM